MINKKEIIPIHINEATAQFFRIGFFLSFAQMIVKTKPTKGIIVIKKITIQSLTEILLV